MRVSKLITLYFFLFGLTRQGHTLDVVFIIVKNSRSDQMLSTDSTLLSVESINNQLLSLSNGTTGNSTVNSSSTELVLITDYSERVIVLNATLLNECAPGYYADTSAAIAQNRSIVCTKCNCKEERWLVRAGGTVEFTPIDPMSPLS